MRFKLLQQVQFRQKVLEIGLGRFFYNRNITFICMKWFVGLFGPWLSTLVNCSEEKLDRTQKKQSLSKMSRFSRITNKIIGKFIFLFALVLFCTPLWLDFSPMVTLSAVPLWRVCLVRVLKSEKFENKVDIPRRHHRHFPLFMKWHPRNERRMNGWSKFWTNQKHYPDVVSPEWNFFAPSSDFFGCFLRLRNWG